jgi:hypothetical protein
MPGREELRRPFGILLLAVLLLGLGLLLANRYVEETRRHVVVRLFQINDSAEVSVDCLPVVLDGDGEVLDLGYLRPDDRVYIAVHNNGGGASWGYAIYSNGELVASGERRGVGPAGYQAERGMVLEKAFTASGHLLGRVGCDGPRHVTRAVAHYQRSPDIGAVPILQRKEQHWSVATWPYAAIHTLGGHALLALALLGAALALLWPPLRDLIRRQRKAVLFGVVTVGALIELGIGLLFDIGWSGSWLLLQIAGAVLLALAAVLALAPHTPSRCPTSSSTRSPNRS